MARGEGPAEERKRTVALMEDDAEPHTGGIAVHHERTVEVGHLEDGTRHEGPLEGLERLSGLRILGEGVASQQACERRRDEPNSRINFR